ncbi:MAG: phospholipase D-like domain-containing protein [Planctomycetaceae bacterium]|jgi:phosphatidylserine/phosphatidylglycerophosphate/cardiolipin synthase-like enzyme|nr:phospholipase D-like domain-containing protein [Planctomycetaceae bacterium]
MNPQQIRQMLVQTLDDRKLTRSERKAMDRILDHLDPDPHALALYRSVAFDLARETLVDPHSVELLEWLEDVVRLLESSKESGGPPTVAETHFAPRDDCPSKIRSLLARARNKVDICVFTITDDRISDAIIETHQRKVSVRVISDDDKSGDRGSDVDRLQAAGIPVRIDRTDDHMHHKFALFDHRLLLNGSYNWTRSAANRNQENFLVSGEPRFVEEFSRLFERLWEQFS